MGVFIWTLEPKEDENREEWFVGYLYKQLYSYWFAGYGEDGERRWVKSKRDAMTYPSQTDAKTAWNRIGKDWGGFVQGGPVKPK